MANAPLPRTAASADVLASIETVTSGGDALRCRSRRTQKAGRPVLASRGDDRHADGAVADRPPEGPRVDLGDLLLCFTHIHRPC